MMDYRNFGKLTENIDQKIFLFADVLEKIEQEIILRNQKLRNSSMLP